MRFGTVLGRLDPTTRMMEFELFIEYALKTLGAIAALVFGVFIWNYTKRNR